MTHNKVDHGDWSTYTSLFSLGFIFCAISDLGINQFVTKEISKSPSSFKRNYPYFFTIKIIITILFPFTMVFVGKLLAYNQTELWFLFWLAFSNSLIQFSQFFRASIQGFQLFKLDAIASNLDKLFFILLLSSLLYLNITNLSSVVFARFASIGLSVVLIGVLMYKNNSWINPQKITSEKTVELFKKTMPFALITILYSFNEKVDQVMIERLAYNREEASIYAAAYRWLDASMMYLWIILPLFFARFSYHGISKKSKELLLETGIGITTVPFIIICIYAFFHGETLFVLFSKSSAHEISLMSRCFQILCFALLLQGCFAILSTYLTSNGYTTQISWSLVISILANSVLNFIFIPKYGAVAAAYTTLASTALLSASYVLIFVNEKIFQLPWLTWAKVFFIGIFTFFSIFLLEIYYSNWLFTLVVTGIICTLLSLLLKLINLKSILKD